MSMNKTLNLLLQYGFNLMTETSGLGRKESNQTKIKTGTQTILSILHTRSPETTAYLTVCLSVFAILSVQVSLGHFICIAISSLHVGKFFINFLSSADFFQN